MDLRDTIREFRDENKHYTNEGSSGVKALCVLLRAMGYKNFQHFGAFDYKGKVACYGDLIDFLEDNSGCVEAIHDWIEEQDCLEWAENIEGHLTEKDEDDDSE